MHVAAVAGSSAEHRAIQDGLLFVIELRRNGNPVVVACGGIPQNDVLLLPVVEEHAAVAAAEDSPLVGLTAAPAVAERRTEALVWNEIRRVHHRSEELVAYKVLEEPNEGGILVAGAEAAAEVGFGDEAAPALADERDAGERGRLRREAEEDLGEEVVIVRQIRRRGISPPSLAGSHASSLVREGTGV